MNGLRKVEDRNWQNLVADLSVIQEQASVWTNTRVCSFPLTDHRDANTRLIPISSVVLAAERDVDLEFKSRSACNRPVVMTYDPCH